MVSHRFSRLLRWVGFPRLPRVVLSLWHGVVELLPCRDFKLGGVEKRGGKGRDGCSPEIGGDIPIVVDEGYLVVRSACL